jgi:hypothetical protein
LRQGNEDGVLIGKVLIQRSNRHICLVSDVVCSGTGVSMRMENASGQI